METRDDIHTFDPKAEKTVAAHFDAAASISYVIVIDARGEEYLYFPDDANLIVEPHPKFPIPSKAITNYSSVATVAYQGSDCQIIIRNGKMYKRC